jgi:hypothetical protein
VDQNVAYETTSDLGNWDSVWFTAFSDFSEPAVPMALV